MSLWTLARWAILVLVLFLVSGLLLFAWSVGWDLEVAVQKATHLWADYAKVVDRIYDFVDRTARFIVPIATIAGASTAFITNGNTARAACISTFASSSSATTNA
jgi:hypothetical protein